MLVGLGVADGDGMPVGLGDADADGLALALADGEAVAEPDGEGDGDAAAVGVGLLAPTKTPRLGGPGVVLVGAGVAGAVPAKATRAASRAAATPPTPRAVSSGAREGRLPVF
jgi:hypothetical protein